MNKEEQLIFDYGKLEFYLKNVIPKKIFIIVDDNTKKYCLPILYNNIKFLESSHIITIKPGENEKNIHTCIKICKKLEILQCDRTSIIINLGGGVITDIGGFVSAIFKRGIRFINVPTTLLSMVDASIGHKNGINLGTIKNEIGTFYTPSILMIDIKFLNTLPSNEMLSGMAEMFKYGLIADKIFWEKMKQKYTYIYDKNTIVCNKLIKKSINIKQNIVNKDPKERGFRKILNFGHTIGHALESYFMNKNNKISHGIAIAKGMICESWISWKTKRLGKKEYKEINIFLSTLFSIKKIFSCNDIEKLISTMKYDKKNEYNNIYFSLIEKIGYCSYNCNVSKSLIKESFLCNFS